MNRKTIIVTGVIIVILAGSAGLMKLFESMKKDPPKKEAQETIIYVKAQTVTYSEISPVIHEGGRLGSQNKVDLITEVQGKILQGQVPLKKGQQFKKGNLLFKVYDGEAVSNLKASKSRFLNSLAMALPDLKIDFPENYQNWEKFFTAIDINKELPLLPETASSKEKTFLAGRNILNEYYLIQSAEIRLKKYSIYAPFNGSFTVVFFEVGSTANPGGRLATVIQTDKLELEVPVKVNDVSLLKQGDKVSVQNGSKIIIADNSGAKIAQIINVDGFKTRLRRLPKASVGSVCTVTIKKGKPELRGNIVKAVIVRQKMIFRRLDGTRLCFEDNAGVIITPEGDPKATEIRGPIAREAAEMFPRLASISSVII